MSSPQASQASRPRRVAAQAGDSKRRQNLDTSSSSEDDSKDGFATPVKARSKVSKTRKTPRPRPSFSSTTKAKEKKRADVPTTSTVLPWDADSSLSGHSSDDDEERRSPLAVTASSSSPWRTAQNSSKRRRDTTSAASSSDLSSLPSDNGDDGEYEKTPVRAPKAKSSTAANEKNLKPLRKRAKSDLPRSRFKALENLSSGSSSASSSKPSSKLTPRPAASSHRPLHTASSFLNSLTRKTTSSSLSMQRSRSSQSVISLSSSTDVDMASMPLSQASTSSALPLHDRHSVFDSLSIPSSSQTLRGGDGDGDEVWIRENVIRASSFVFVKLSHLPHETGVEEMGTRPFITEEGRFWWPATITQDTTSLIVPLPTHPSDVGSPLTFRNEIILVPSDPSPATVRALRRGGHFGPVQFGTANFYTGNADGDEGPPRGLGFLWSAAVKHVTGDDDDDDVEVHLSLGSDEVEAAINDSDGDEEEGVADEADRRAKLKELEHKRECAKEWINCYKDDYVGKKVLARARAGDVYYWPAIILDVSLRSGLSRTIWFTVQRWGESQPKTVKRDAIFTETDAGFYTCKMGQRRVIGGTPEPAPSASSSSSYPSSASAFKALSIPDQVSHVLPVLHAVIRDDFPPAREVVDKWYRSRDRAMADDIAWGGMKEVEEMIMEVKVQMLTPNARRGRRQAQGEDARVVLSQATPSEEGMDVESGPVASGAITTSVQHTQDPTSMFSASSQDPPSDLNAHHSLASAPVQNSRPRGSARYEALHNTERNGFVVDVLALQAARQIILRRQGVRTRPYPNSFVLPPSTARSTTADPTVDGVQPQLTTASDKALASAVEEQPQSDLPRLDAGFELEDEQEDEQEFYQLANDLLAGVIDADVEGDLYDEVVSMRTGDPVQVLMLAKREREAKEAEEAKEASRKRK